MLTDSNPSPFIGNILAIALRRDPFGPSEATWVRETLNLFTVPPRCGRHARRQKGVDRRRDITLVGGITLRSAVSMSSRAKPASPRNGKASCATSTACNRFDPEKKSTHVEKRRRSSYELTWSSTARYCDLTAAWE
jgi:hypothetical protein